jgi:hypothetical protein
MIQALLRMEDLSQKAFSQMLENRVDYVVKSTAWVNVSKYVSVNELFGLRYYDPLLVQNGAMMKRMVSQPGVRVHQRNISETYICHLAWVVSREKIKVFMNSGSWFLTSEGPTCGPLPDMRLYQEWQRSII